MIHWRAHIAVTDANLRLHRHSIPKETKLLEMAIQCGNALLVRFCIQSQREIVTRKLINILTRFQQG